MPDLASSGYARLANVPADAVAGDAWHPPRLPRRQVVASLIAELVLRAGGMRFEAERLHDDRTDHRRPYWFDGVEWSRPAAHGGVQTISADGSTLGGRLSDGRDLRDIMTGQDVDAAFLTPAENLRLCALEDGVRRVDRELADVRGAIEGLRRVVPDGRAIAQAIDLDILAGRLAEAGAR